MAPYSRRQRRSQWVAEVAVELLPDFCMLQRHMEQSCMIKAKSKELQQRETGVQRPLVPRG